MLFKSGWILPNWVDSKLKPISEKIPLEMDIYHIPGIQAPSSLSLLGIITLRDLIETPGGKLLSTKNIGKQRFRLICRAILNAGYQYNAVAYNSDNPYRDRLAARIYQYEVERFYNPNPL